MTSGRLETLTGGSNAPHADVVKPGRLLERSQERLGLLLGLLMFSGLLSAVSSSAVILRKREPGCRPNGLRIAVIQLASANAHWYSTHAQAINMFYARRHGYDFISHACPPTTRHSYMWDDNDQSRINWAKPAVLMQHLPSYDFVLFLDSDAIISDMSLTIEEMAELYLTGDFGMLAPRNCLVGPDRDPSTYSCWDDDEGVDGLNTGALLLKRNNKTMRILHQWAESVHGICKQFTHPHWPGSWVANEQRCLSLLYKNCTMLQQYMYMLSPAETFMFTGGAERGWVMHLMGASRDQQQIGQLLQARLVALAAKPGHSSMADAPSGTPVAAGAAATVAKEGLQWVKHPQNPLIGGSYGTCFDVAVLRALRDGEPRYRMYLSWRPEQAIAVLFSGDGVTWSEPTVVLRGLSDSAWEDDVNRPNVIRESPTKFTMWYTGQYQGSTSQIGVATSEDGLTWQRRERPVLEASLPWEQPSLMCSHVLFEPKTRVYRMWYGGGGQHESVAIGHAVSSDGIVWDKAGDPVFQPMEDSEWERDRVGCPTVVYNGEYYYMFYIGWVGGMDASIGLARSRNGLDGWQRHPRNPILTHGLAGSWDAEAVYKPAVFYDGSKWLMWYNGRDGHVEQIGLATLESHDLGFDTVYSV